MNRKDQLASLVALERQVERGSRRTDNGWERLQSSLAAPITLAQPEVSSERLLTPVRNAHWVHLAGIGALGLAGAVGWLALQHPGGRSTLPTVTTPRAIGSVVAQQTPVALPEVSSSSAFPPRAASAGAAVVESAGSLPSASALAAKSTAIAAEARAPVPTATSSRSTFEQELRLIKSARDAVDRGETSQAFALINQHARQFPHGVFADEREALHALATCGTANRARRAALASGFAHAYPRSPYLDRVKRACQPADEK